ncbi:hypothetical protein QE152_g27475 [Popillia japonica]|uniref:Uncharacterized protein n=1 Tax=Popillia japonica TaxID=7064 RepID=A0AAW1JVB1_POPJA
MPIKVLQTNVGRACAAQHLAYATPRQWGVDILIVSEPKKKRVHGMKWLKDNRTNVAALFLSKNIEVLGHRTGDGYLLTSLKDLDIVCY